MTIAYLDVSWPCTGGGGGGGGEGGALAPPFQINDIHLFDPKFLCGLHTH